jgi:hypothetical protein
MQQSGFTRIVSSEMVQSALARGRRGRGCRTRRPPLADPGRLAGETAKVIQLRPPDAAVPHHFDTIHPRRAKHERALDAYLMGDSADGKRAIDLLGAVLTDHKPLEDLNPLLAPLDNADVDPHRVADLYGAVIVALAIK